MDIHHRRSVEQSPLRRTVRNGELGFWLERLLAEADVVLDVDVEADSVKAFCTCSYGRWNGHERTIVYAREEVV